jgi:hypothetical protein
LGPELYLLGVELSNLCPDDSNTRSSLRSTVGVIRGPLESYPQRRDEIRAVFSKVERWEKKGDHRDREEFLIVFQ